MRARTCAVTSVPSVHVVAQPAQALPAAAHQLVHANRLCLVALLACAASQAALNMRFPGTLDMLALQRSLLLSIAHAWEPNAACART